MPLSASSKKTGRRRIMEVKVEAKVFWCIHQRAASFMMHPQAAFDRVGKGMALAEEAFKRVEEESDSEDDDTSSTSSGRSLPPPVVGEDDLRPLESVAKKARSAGRTATKVCVAHADT